MFRPSCVSHFIGKARCRCEQRVTKSANPDCRLLPTIYRSNITPLTISCLPKLFESHQTNQRGGTKVSDERNRGESVSVRYACPTNTSSSSPTANLVGQGEGQCRDPKGVGLIASHLF